jgi:hypothetical protein
MGAPTVTQPSAERYWQLGNVVTGFVVLQSITFLFALADEGKFCRIREAKDVLLLPGYLACLVYVLAVVFCYVAANEFRAKADRSWVYTATMVGQLVIVAANSIGIIWAALEIMGTDGAAARCAAAMHGVTG